MPPRTPEKQDGVPPLPCPQVIEFVASEEGYADSDSTLKEGIVLGDVPVGTAQKLVSIPALNSPCLHDPPGDGSYAFLEDSFKLKGLSRICRLRSMVHIPAYLCILLYGWASAASARETVSGIPLRRRIWRIKDIWIESIPVAHWGTL